MLSEANRAAYYQALQLPPTVIREVEEMRLNSPSRKLSQRGLKNILVDFYSARNGARRRFESYTGEFLFGLELEVFGCSHEYWVQVSPKNIERYGKTSSMTIDFMVLDKDHIRLIECKPRRRLEKLALEHPGEWVLSNDRWLRPAVMEWAEHRGLSYEIWSPPEPHGIYQANLLALYGVVTSNCIDAANDRCICHLRKILTTRVVTLREALDQIKGLTGAHVLAAMAKGYLHSPIKSIPIDAAERFTLYGSESRAREYDDQMLADLRFGLAQPNLSSAVLMARPVDHERGVMRLERALRMLEGKERLTRRYAPLVRRVAEARKSGDSALAVCVTRYGQSGRRVEQLTNDQEKALAWAIKQFRTDALLRTKVQAHDALRIHCEREGIRTPSRTTFHNRLRGVNHLVRAYTEGGYRAYHAAEPAIDPSDRTLRCLIPGLMAHVDATKFDVRCSPDLIANLGFECPTVYIAMDSATGRPLGRAVMFGHACRNALAVLIRDVLHRQGFLPRYWVADGGSEYTGEWFESFCSVYGATRVQPPPGNPRKNSLAENALGRINAEHAHKFLGSTAPDQCGRSVTARQKSRVTAVHNYKTIVDLLDIYLFSDMSSVPHGANRLSPKEKSEVLSELFGAAGVVRVTGRDDFLIATSVPIERDIKVERGRGIRHLQRTYTSGELLHRIGTSPALEKRLDCVDSRRMYVKFSSGWVLATTADSLRNEGRGDMDKLSEALFDRDIRGENARIRRAARIDRAIRTAEANATAGSAEHLMPADNKTIETISVTKRRKRRWSSPDQSTQPFVTEDSE
jgi:transposase InsO family protein